MQSKQTPKHNAAEQTWLKVQTDAAQAEKQQHQQRQRQRRLKNDLIFNLQISRALEFIQFGYTVGNIPNRIGKTALKFEKEILKWPSYSSRFLEYGGCGYFTLLFCD